MSMCLCVLKPAIITTVGRYEVDEGGSNAFRLIINNNTGPELLTD